MKQHAVVQITGATVSAVGAALGIVTTVIGVLCAPVTAGASLALTAVGVAATGKPPLIGQIGSNQTILFYDLMVYHIFH